MAVNRGPVPSTSGSNAAVRPWQLTEPERAVQFRQLVQLQEDIKQLGGMDVSRPFTNLEDAVNRLFPFHILGAQDGGEADLDETPDHAGSGLVSSRSDAWLEISVRRAADAASKVQAFVSRMQAHEAKEAANGRKVKAEERYLWEKLMHQSAKEALAAERALQPPPAPVLQLPQLQLPAGGQTAAMAQLLALQQQQQQLAKQLQQQQQQGLHGQQVPQQAHQLQAAILQQQQQLQAAQSLAARQQQQQQQAPQQQQQQQQQQHQQQQLAALLAHHMQPQQPQQQGAPLPAQQGAQPQQLLQPQQLQQLQTMLLQAQQARQGQAQPQQMQQMQPQQMQLQQMQPQQTQPQQLQPQQMQPQQLQPQQAPPPS